MNLSGNRDFVFNPTVNCEILIKELKWTTNVLKKRVFRSGHLGVPGSPELCCLGCSVGMRQRVCLFSEVTVAEMTTGLQDICQDIPIPGSSDIKTQEDQGSWQDRFQTCGYPLPHLPIPRSSKSVGLMMILRSFMEHVLVLSKHLEHTNSAVVTVLFPFPSRRTKMQGS